MITVGDVRMRVRVRDVLTTLTCPRINADDLACIRGVRDVRCPQRPM